MAYKGIHQYTPKEASNISMGQVGTVFLDTGYIAPDGTKSGTLFQPSNGVIIAITSVWNASFVDLIPEDATKFLGDTGTGYESGGDIFDPETNSNDGTNDGKPLPAGITIYGRWSGVRVYYNSDTDVGDDGTLDSKKNSKIICYIGA